jgi:hypothetical protein
MFSSQTIKTDIVLALYNDRRTVFRLRDIALLTGETNFISLNKKVNYAVRTGKLLNPRKGIYAKPGYKPEELACSVYAPAYISLEYVLQKEGIIFQYDTRITAVSYLNKSILVDDRTYVFRKIKNTVLIDTSGIVQQNEQVNIATAERAFLDLFYLSKEYYFDNLSPLNKEKIFKLLPLYRSKALTARVKSILNK